MLQRDILSWWFRPSFLQPWGRKSPVLFAGPWLGEFGWELMNWQPFLRWLAPQYERVVVSVRRGTEALYADFAHEIVHHDVRGTSDCNTMTGIEDPEALQRALRARPEGADHLVTVGWQPDRRKRFISFGHRDPDVDLDVVFHARGRTHGADRNWDAGKWSVLVDGLVRKGLRVGAIGLRNATVDVRGDFQDLRDLPLTRTMDVLASAALCIGPSSGPIHLASLCGTPHLVWTDRKKYARGRTNREKYEAWWNPLATPAFVLDEEGFDPAPESVLARALEVL